MKSFNKLDVGKVLTARIEQEVMDSNWKNLDLEKRSAEIGLQIRWWMTGTNSVSK